MFTLLKLGVSLVALLAFAWFGMTQKLGSRTLFEHMHAIGQTKESQELMDGTRQAAGHGLIPVARYEVSQTTAYIGSTVIVCRR